MRYAVISVEKKPILTYFKRKKINENFKNCKKKSSSLGGSYLSYLQVILPLCNRPIDLFLFFIIFNVIQSDRKTKNYFCVSFDIVANIHFFAYYLSYLSVSIKLIGYDFLCFLCIVDQRKSDVNQSKLQVYHLCLYDNYQCILLIMEFCILLYPRKLVPAFIKGIYSKQIVQNNGSQQSFLNCSPSCLNASQSQGQKCTMIKCGTSKLNSIS